MPGLVEFDAAAWRRRCSTPPQRRWPDGEPVAAVGITNQRASTVVWDRATGEPIGPGARLAGPAHRRCECIMAKAEHGLAPRTEPVGDEGRVAARQRGRPRRPRPVLRHGRHLDRVDAVGRRRSTSPTTRTPPSPACCDPTDRRGTTACSTRCTSRRRAAGDRRLERRRRRGDALAGARRRSPARRRPAGLARRPGLRHRRPGQDHVRHRRHARPVPGRRAAGSARRGPHGTFPIVAWSQDGR